MKADRWLVAAVAGAPPAWLLLAPWVDSGRHAGMTGLLAAGLLYPVLEELCFRGWLQGCLRDRLGDARAGPVSTANLVTSLLFAAAHLATQPLAWAIGVLGPSLVFGQLRERYGGVLVPALVHVWCNTGLVLTARVVPG